MRENSKTRCLESQSYSTNAQNIDVDEHCDLFTSLQRKYQWPSEQWAPVMDSMVRIKRRATDERLFLGVIGEFSSGKSTFINALLREEILKTDILPATTCAATVLGYGNKVDAEISFQDGTVVRYSQNGLSWWGKFSRKLFCPGTKRQFESAKTFIHRYTAEETQAKTVLRVNVTHPNEKLRSGLMIVDTPGLNADNPRHAEVTQIAVRQLCDATVLVIPATAACSSTLIAFLKENIPDAVHRCIVLITKIDLIPLRERPRVLKYVSTRLENEMKRRFAAFVTAAPCHVVTGEDRQEPASREDISAYRVEFERAEQTILRILGESRTSIIAEQLLVILVSTLADLNSAVEVRHGEYSQRHEALKQNCLPNFQKFIQSSKSRYDKVVRTSSAHAVKSLLDNIAGLREQLSRTIESDIRNTTGKGDLKRVFEKVVSCRFKAVAVELEAISRAVVVQIDQNCQGCLNEFQMEFQKSFRNLATLGGTIKSSDTIDTSLNQVQSITTTQTAKSSIKTISAVNTSTAFKAAGVGTGAVVGSFVCPGIGTAIGAGIGFFLGALFGPSLDQLKQTAISDSNKAVSDWMSECGMQMDVLVEDQVLADLQCLFAIIDNYAKIYENKVREMVKQDEAAKQQLMEYIRIAKSDSAELRKREEKCRTLIEALKSAPIKRCEEET